MIEQVDLQTIKIVLGDTIHAYFRVEGEIPFGDIEATFVCRELGIQETLIPCNDSEDSEDSEEEEMVWMLIRDSDDLRPGNFRYDFTVKAVEDLQNPKIETLVYHGNLIILPRGTARTTYKPYWEFPHNTKKEH